MNKVLVIILGLMAGLIGLLLFPDGPAAILIGSVIAVPSIIFLSSQTEDKNFILKIFYIALIVRILTAVFIYLFNLQGFFGPDSEFYDIIGHQLSGYWSGIFLQPPAHKDSGWGMIYIVGTVYYLIGRNPLAIQFFCAALGAATAAAAYLCANEIYSNKRVARVTALIVALCPSLALWSSQALKDGIIVFFLVLSMVCVLRLQKKYDHLSFVVLMASLVGILSLRFYIFYMLIVAIVGCFVVGSPLNPVAVLRRVTILLVIGLAIGSFAGERGAQDISQFNLEKVQNTREDLARGNAGFGKDIDVSTTEGAISALPIGLLYLMLAPFPWQLGNLRQAITLPEMLAWYAAIPFLVSGLIFTIKHRLQNAIAILLFTLMLTIAYSLSQGNIGTAYRQRAQIQIFHFMFIAVGFTLWQEKKENERLRKISRRNNDLNRFR